MADPKNPPAWFKKRVYDINLKLINECGMSWEGVLKFWEDLIAEVKSEKAETKTHCQCDEPLVRMNSKEYCGICELDIK